MKRLFGFGTQSNKHAEASDDSSSSRTKHAEDSSFINDTAATDSEVNEAYHGQQNFQRNGQVYHHPFVRGRNRIADKILEDALDDEPFDEEFIDDETVDDESVDIKSVDDGDVSNHATARDPEFLYRLQMGDAQAWEQLVDEWSPKLYNYMCYNTRTPEDAQDVLSDTLLGLVQSIKNFDGNVNLSTFMYSIAYRKVADYWRRSKQTYELPLWLSTAGPSSVGIELQEALAELPEQAQQALLLRYHVGLSVAEIAEILGRSYKATESLLSRVRRQFHHAFLGAEA